MSVVDRRSLLRAGALAGIAASTSARAAGAVKAVWLGSDAVLVVHDSRIAESRAFAGLRGGIDLARGWAAVRAHPGAARIEGLTGWSDYVALRGLFGARGMRVVREERVAAPLSRRTHLFRWSLVAQGPRITR